MVAEAEIRKGRSNGRGAQVIRDLDAVPWNLDFLLGSMGSKAGEGHDWAYILGRWFWLLVGRGKGTAGSRKSCHIAGK